MVHKKKQPVVHMPNGAEEVAPLPEAPLPEAVSGAL